MYGKIKRVGILLKGFKEQYRLGQLGIYFLFLLLLWFLGTNFVYISEKLFLSNFPEIYEKSVFSDYASSYWNIVIYLLSGIEDKEPLSMAGKVGAFMILLSSIVLVGVFTGTLTSIIIERVNRRKYLRFKPLNGTFEEHIVICGINSSLSGLINELSGLSDRQTNIVVISEMVDRMEKPKHDSEHTVWGVQGDPSDFETLRRADIQSARSIIILSTDDVTPCESDSRSLLIALAVRRLNPRIYLCAQIRDPRNKSLFFEAKIDEVIALDDFFNRLLTQSINIKGIGKLYRLISKSNVDFGQIIKMPVPENYLERNLSFSEIKSLMIDDQEDVTVIGIEKNTGPNQLKQDRDFGYIEINPRKIKQKYSQIDANYRPAAGDNLIIIGRKN